MDIATLLESHRKYTIEAFGDDQLDGMLGQAHDRATTKTLLDMYRSGNAGNGQQPVGQASPAQPATVTSRKVKAGSKAARQRALKAGETRRKNLAAKAGAAAGTPTLTSTQPGFQGTMITDDPKLSPATHLAPRPPEGGGA